MLFIKESRPTLNTQTDSVPAKLFTVVGNSILLFSTFQCHVSHLLSTYISSVIFFFCNYAKSTELILLCFARAHKSHRSNSEKLCFKSSLSENNFPLQPLRLVRRGSHFSNLSRQAKYILSRLLLVIVVNNGDYFQQGQFWENFENTNVINSLIVWVHLRLFF